MPISITSRDDLPFIASDANGEIYPWYPRHDLDTHADAIHYGLACADALAQLARADAEAARLALKHALLADNWNGECGEEEGLVEGIVRAAIAGWRNEAVTAAITDSHDAQWHTLNARLAAMETQLNRLRRSARG